MSRIGEADPTTTGAVGAPADGVALVDSGACPGLLAWVGQPFLGHGRLEPTELDALLENLTISGIRDSGGPVDVVVALEYRVQHAVLEKCGGVMQHGATWLAANGGGGDPPPAVGRPGESARSKLLAAAFALSRFVDGVKFKTPVPPKAGHVVAHELGRLSLALPKVREAGHEYVEESNLTLLASLRR